jgi:uncharacterized protein
MSNYPFRTALVTGASSGIGEAMARRLCADGVTVIVVGRREENLQALADEFADTEVLVADLTDPADVARVAARAEVVDLLVNNAGLGLHGATVDALPCCYDGQIAVNVGAVVELSRAAVSGMAERGKGWILNVSSVAGGVPTPMDAAYGASKAFVTSYSDALGLETRKNGIVVTALLPGYTHSEFHSSSGSTATPGKPAWMWQTAEKVAAVGLADAAAGKTRSVPGLHNKLAVVLTRYLPRSIVNRLVNR